MGDNVTIWDDGLDPASLAVPFDLEGMPKQKVVFIENGVAKGFVYDSKTAKKDGVKSTGHASAIEGWPVRSSALQHVPQGGRFHQGRMLRSTKPGPLGDKVPLHPLSGAHERSGHRNHKGRHFLFEDGWIVAGLRTSGLPSQWSRHVLGWKQLPRPPE